MGILKNKNIDESFRFFAELLQVILEDQEINTRVVQLLKLNSFRRRSLLNKWLEKLRRKGAPEKLMQALSCLFDDGIAEKVLSLVDNYKIKNSKNDLFLNDTKL